MNRLNLLFSIHDLRFTIYCSLLFTIYDSRFTVFLDSRFTAFCGYTPAQSFTEGRREGGAKTLLIDSDLFEPYERLVTIEILGRRVEVPENNRLLRCFQFLSMRSISYGDFCWNGDCTNCQVWYREPGQPESQDRTALACRLDVREGLVVTRLNPHIRIKGVNS